MDKAILSPFSVSVKGLVAFVEGSDSWCVADLEDAHSFTQEQLDVCIYENQKPPLGLLQGLELPAERAYEWAKNENGHMCRRFVHNKEWIDEGTPWWYGGEGEEEGDSQEP